MATERMPSAQDIQALVEFLPTLYGEDAPPPIAEWTYEYEDGSLHLPWAHYSETVNRLIDHICDHEDCWLDRDYDPEEAQKLFSDKEAVKNATLPELQRMITVFVRGERFCEGWWGKMIRDGDVRRILERLAEIGAES